MQAKTFNRKIGLLDDDQDLTDQQLALLVMQGDEPAVRRLVERHQEMVLRVAMRMLGNRHDAEDVAQETFVRAVRSLSSWDQERKFLPWLLAIATNRCRTAISKRREWVYDQQVLAECCSSDDDLAQQHDQLAEEVNRALREIRSDYRQAFQLFHNDQLAYAEIAEVLDIPLGTVKTWVYRARQEVARLLRQRGVVEMNACEEVYDDLRSSRTSTAKAAG